MTTDNDQNSIQDRVDSICNDLYSNGTKPSVRLVLSMLPDINSTSTVHKYFAKWKKALEANEKSLYDKLGFSSEFTKSFMQEITRFSVEAEQRYKEQSVDATEQREIALEDLEKSENRLHKQTAVVSQLEKEVAELQNEITKIQIEYQADHKKSTELAEAAMVREKEKHAAVVSELRQQLIQSDQINAALTKTSEVLRTDLAKAELKLEGNSEYIEEIKSQNKTFQDENRTLNKTVAALNNTVAKQESTIEGNAKLIANLESSATNTQAYLAKADTELESLKAGRQNLEKELGEINKKLFSTSEKLQRTEAANLDLRKNIDEQSAVIKTLTK